MSEPCRHRADGVEALTLDQLAGRFPAGKLSTCRWAWGVAADGAPEWFKRCHGQEVRIDPNVDCVGCGAFAPVDPPA